MTDAQMLQNLEAVYEAMVIINGRRWGILDAAISAMKEIIAALRRRIELEGK